MSRKDLADVCNYSKALVIPSIPDDFVVAERFRHGLTDDEIRKGIAAFREFLYAFFEKLAGGKDQPEIIYFALTLFTLGFHGRLETEPEKRLTVRGEDMLTVICPVTERYHSLIRMSGEQKLKIFRLLSDLGLQFNGAGFSEEVDFSKTGKFYITSDKNEFFAVGLKLIAAATANNKYYIKIENLFESAFLRCDFYPLANATPKRHVVKIKEFACAQPPEIREWIFDIDKLLSDNGCTVTHNLSCEFIYAKRKTKNRKGMVCKIYMDIDGCSVTPGMNHFENPDNIISILPEDIIDLMKVEADRECGWCAYSRRDPGSIQCRPGCPVKFTHNGEEYLKCRYVEFKIP
ncbi:MAG: hypothetical protein FWC96_09715, partial [Oscillospiraceae bacterium]|nr:hypothetical protein [Oscillospiraceae bacterium]